jgi:hypothetical protein
MFGKQSVLDTPSSIQEWYDSTVLAPMRQQLENMAYDERFVGVQEDRENFWRGALNLATLGLYNAGSVATTGYDIYDQRIYGTERGIAIAEFSLAVASVVPWSRVAALGGEAAEFLSMRASEVGAFLDETAPFLNPSNYRYDPAKLYGGLPLPDYVSPTAVQDATWTVGSHGDMPSPRPIGYESHHGVNSVWMEANTPGYNASDAPAILMQNDPFHNATRGVFNSFRSETATLQGVSPRNIDWSQVSPGTAWRLAEEQLEAAQVPANVRAEYFRQLNEYLDSLP